MWRRISDEDYFSECDSCDVVYFTSNVLENILSLKQIVLCGDFNIDMISDSVHFRRLQDSDSRFLTDSVKRVGERSVTMINLCYSNVISNNIKCRDEIPVHSILEINLRGGSETIPNKIRSVCVWSD